jgi:hypothetical protein
VVKLSKFWLWAGFGWRLQFAGRCRRWYGVAAAAVAGESAPNKLHGLTSPFREDPSSLSFLRTEVVVQNQRMPIMKSHAQLLKAAKHFSLGAFTQVASSAYAL